MTVNPELFDLLIVLDRDRGLDYNRGYDVILFRIQIQALAGSVLQRAALGQPDKTTWQGARLGKCPIRPVAT